jgi:hypothetical protein
MDLQLRKFIAEKKPNVSIDEQKQNRAEPKSNNVLKPQVAVSLDLG